MFRLKNLMFLLLVLPGLLTTATTGRAANFSVAPVRVVMNGLNRTERLTLKNESDRPLVLLIKPYLWTQGADGADRYEEISDLIIFPKVLTILPGEERAVRIGIGAAPTLVEKAYRIYLEEQPSKDDQTSQGAVARVLMRIGIPVFVQPLKHEPILSFTEMAIARNGLHLTLANSGNSFAMAEQILVRGLDAKGTELFSKVLGGFYLLAGTRRTFDVTLPKEQCAAVTRLTANTRNNGTDIHKALDTISGVCGVP
ncbi:MAG: fimbria/pilus periplasmic chaperone [Geobacter sp.]|nr:fimbria/pilus periplasmic chaperone [Geobacter sp.]